MTVKTHMPLSGIKTSLKATSQACVHSSEGKALMPSGDHTDCMEVTNIGTEGLTEAHSVDTLPLAAAV